MIIYVVTTDYFDNYRLGSYSTLLKARQAIMNLVAQTDELISCESVGNYAYHVMDNRGEYYWFQIFVETIDAE